LQSRSPIRDANRKKKDRHSEKKKKNIKDVGSALKKAAAGPTGLVLDGWSAPRKINIFGEPEGTEKGRQQTRGGKGWKLSTNPTSTTCVQIRVRETNRGRRSTNGSAVSKNRVGAGEITCRLLRRVRRGPVNEQVKKEACNVDHEKKINPGLGVCVRLFRMGISSTKRWFQKSRKTNLFVH